MASYSNPNYFMPAYAAEADAATNLAGQMIGPSVPFSPIHKALHAADVYGHITIPVVLRSGARAITQGGYLDMGGLGPENDYGWLKNEWLEKYSPRAWRRSATAWSFDPRMPNNFNMLFWHSSTDKRGQLTKLGERLQGGLQKSRGLYDPKTAALNENHWLRKSGILNESGELAHLWDPRMLSRISASGDFARMDTLSGANVNGLMNYLKAGRSEGLAGGVERFLEGGGKIAGKDAAMLTRFGVTGALSGRMMGSMEALRFGTGDISNRLAGMGIRTDELNDSVRLGLRWGQSVRNWAVDESGQKLSYSSILRGKAISQGGASAAKVAGKDVAETAGKSIAKKFAARLALTGAEAAGAIGEAGLNPVLDILAIASIAQLGFDVAHVGAEVVADQAKTAMKSFRGDINRTPGGGFGFHDTVASATARQRGLQAIASSRLNARSILGNEAGPMASHFAGSEMGY